ncbi:hypothetical protein ACFL29_02410, partial [Patescibacteria group bacterium]
GKKSTAVPSEVIEKVDGEWANKIHGDSAEKRLREYSGEHRRRLREALDKVEAYPILAGLIELREGAFEVLNKPLCSCEGGLQFKELLVVFVEDERPIHMCGQTHAAFEELKDWDKEALKEALSCAAVMMAKKDKSEILKEKLVEVLVLMRNYGIRSKEVIKYLRTTEQNLGEDGKNFLELAATLAYLIEHD